MTTTIEPERPHMTDTHGQTPRPPRVESGFPARRMRRLRRTEGLRRLTRETLLDPGDFIFPLFVSEVVSEPTPISSMPGQYQWPVSEMGRRADAQARPCCSACPPTRMRSAHRHGTSRGQCNRRFAR